MITLVHEVALPTNEPADIVNNRSSVRLEYEKHFLENYYFRFDTKLIGFYANDHQAKAIDNDLYIKATCREALMQYSSGPNVTDHGVYFSLTS